MKKIIIALLPVLVIVSSVKSQDNGEFKTRSQTPKSEKKEKDDSDEKAYKEGQIGVTIGYGYPNMYKEIYKAIFTNVNSYGGTWGYDVKGIGPAFVKFEYGVSKLIGLGLVIGYSDVKLTQTQDYTQENYNSTTGMYDINNYRDVWKYTYTSLSIGARLNFHFGTGKKLDPYAGLGAGYSRKEHKFTYSTNNPNQVQPAPATFNAYFPVYFGITAGLRYYFTPNIGIYGEVGFDKWSLIQAGLAAKF